MKAASATRPLSWRKGAHPSYAAFVVHRISGLALAAFLPLHFWALGQAIEGEAALDGFLGWAERPLVKLGEFVLVVLLAAHLAGGVRLLILEFLGWSDWQKTAVAVTAGFSAAAGALFLLNLAG
ncbi:MAG TPA: succinate dehydrogenase, cytochrome b556 subunit [Alphaproteobacteria bacterium]